MRRSAIDRRHAPRQRMAAISMLMLGVLSLSAAGWIAGASSTIPVERAREAGPPASENRAGGPGGPTRAESSTRSSTSLLDTGREGQARAGKTTHPREPVNAEAVTAPAVVEVPSIGIRSELIDLGLDEDRRLQVPADPDLAGWWVGGPRPGEQGPAVIAGHVDSAEGPAVFSRLQELEPGDRITIYDDQGAATDFRVDRVGSWPKDDFPTDEVYRQADGPELRLITCGGRFDRQTRSYLDNVIVFATVFP